MNNSDAMTTSDDVAVRRANISKAVSLGKRLGYSMFLAAMVIFFVGLFVTGYKPWMTALMVVLLIVGSILLAPAIVFGYGVKAAVREERQEQALLDQETRDTP